MGTGMGAATGHEQCCIILIQSACEGHVAQASKLK